MTIVGKNLTLGDFRTYCRNYDFGKVRPSSLVIHHTWRPRKEEWRGDVSIEGLRKYYEGKGWKAGPHLFIAEDGIWLFTPMNEVGIHAGTGNSTYKWGRLIGYSIGIEVVGDYDAEKWTGQTLSNTLGTIKILMGHLGISTENLTFHRDWMPAKTCPGSAIEKSWLMAELVKLDSDGKFVGSQGEPSAWAKVGWDWFQEKGFDRSVNPSQTVSAEAIATYLYKLYGLIKEGK